MLQDKIREIYDNREYDRGEALIIFLEFLNLLNIGQIRAAEKIGDKWLVNEWVKQGILLGFRLGEIVDMPYSDHKNFTDKSTYPEKWISANSGIRVVPGGSSVRTGSYIARGVTIMPPAYVNVGAYVDSGSMIDSHALVGSCAQIGKSVHLSAGAMIGGVLEPINATPVIIEDNAFIGGNSGLYEGVLVQEGAIIAPGTIITKGTPVFDAVNNKYLEFEKSPVIPPNAVVVPGSRPLKSNPNFQLYCPIIVKYRDDKSSTSVELENLLR